MSREVEVSMQFEGRTWYGTAVLTPEVLYDEGQAISLIGSRYRGIGTVARNNDDGSVSVRIFDENSRQRKRVRVFASEVDSMLTEATPAVASEFTGGDNAILNGVRFVGPVVVEKVDGGDVIVRHTATGKRLRVFSSDLSAGRLILA